jgi:hypothetical protein
VRANIHHLTHNLTSFNFHIEIFVPSRAPLFVLFLFSIVDQRGTSFPKFPELALDLSERAVDILASEGSRSSQLMVFTLYLSSSFIQARVSTNVYRASTCVTERRGPTGERIAMPCPSRYCFGCQPGFVLLVSLVFFIKSVQFPIDR